MHLPKLSKTNKVLNIDDLIPIEMAIDGQGVELAIQWMFYDCRGDGTL